MNVSIKEATFEDLPQVAEIQVRSWRETYVGLVPQEYLDGMSIPARQKKWEELFRGDSAGDPNLYLAWDGREAVGFISFGHARDARKEGFGEIYAVYLLKQSWGRGIGHALFERAARKLREDGMADAYLWVLDGNERAIAAYGRWGGILDKAMLLTGHIGGREITEIAVNFDLR